MSLNPPNFDPNLQQVKQEQIPEVDTPPPITFSTILQSGAGFGVQFQYLKDNIITPFRNRVVYENAGQLEDKLPLGIYLHETNKDSTAMIVEALRNELSIQESGTNVGLIIVPNNHNYTRNCSTGVYSFISDAIEKAQQYEYAIIFYQADPKYAHIESGFQMSLVPGKNLLVVASTEKNVFDYMNRYSSSNKYKLLHIPDYMTTHVRQTVLCQCISKWINLPGPQLIDVVVKKTSAFTPVDVKTLCQKVYSLGLARLMDNKGLSDNEIIRGEDVRVEVDDWKAAFNGMVEPNESWDPEDGTLAQKRPKVPTEESATTIPEKLDLNITANQNRVVGAIKQFVDQNIGPVLDIKITPRVTGSVMVMVKIKSKKE